MNTLSQILNTIDSFVWGPPMLLLLVGTGVVLCIRTRFLPWRKLPFALKSTLQRSARTVDASGGRAGGISPFSALMTSLAATIGTGNIIGVATALVLGGPGALVWMWIAAAFGIASKFSECMLAVKYRERNARGETVGGPMYTLKNAFPCSRIGKALGFLFALFTVLSSFGIGNMTQANSIADALYDTFSVPARLTGLILTALTLLIVVGGIRSISKIATVLVPSMALLYIAAGLIILAVNYHNIPQSLVQIITMAFSKDAVTGGTLGTITASALRAMRYGVARGVFSNEAGMGSAAITAAPAAAASPVRQGYINMTGTFWDTIVVCTITGLCIMSSGVLGIMETSDSGIYADHSGQLVLLSSHHTDCPAAYDIANRTPSSLTLILNLSSSAPKAETFYPDGTYITLTRFDPGGTSPPDDKGNGTNMPYPHSGETISPAPELSGTWRDPHGCLYTFRSDGTYDYAKPLTGAALTIAAFRSTLGDTGAYFLTVSIVLFAFSTILGWEYLGEKAFEYLMNTHRYNLLYRMIFSCAACAGASAALDIVWNFSNIANALMAVPNLLCLLILSGEVAAEIRQYETGPGRQKNKIRKH